MSEMATKLYQHFQNGKLFTYSHDVQIKSCELDAIKELEDNGYIIVKTRTIGYVIADIA